MEKGDNNNNNNWKGRRNKMEIKTKEILEKIEKKKGDRRKRKRK